MRAPLTAAICLLLVGCAHGTRHVTAPPTPEPPPVVVAPPSHEHEPERVPIRVHRVAAGETLYRIALRYGVPVKVLEAANGILDPTAVKVGQNLVIPGGAETRSGSERQEPPRHARSEPRLTDPDRKGVLDWPLRGVLYARFGTKGDSPHEGIDLAAPLGTPVKTAAPGRVIFAGEQHGYGLIVIVEHDDGLITLYAHDKDLRVKSGQPVRRGQVIATVGESGRTSGPHLHFEVRKDGKPVDPLDYLGAVPKAEAAVPSARR